MNILVTGASRGMGLNHVKILSLNKKNKILITDISNLASKVFSKNEEKLLNKILSQNNVSIVYGDLNKKKDLDIIISKTKSFFKSKLDAIICNAGGDIPGKSLSGYADQAKINDYMIDTATFKEIFERNFHTTFNTLKKIIPIMKKNKSGKIITISSINAIFDSTNEFAYSIAKNSIIKFTKILARDLKKFNIQVNCLCPGPTFTTRFKHTLGQRKKNESSLINKKKGFDRVATMDEISNIINFLLSKDAEIITGQVIVADLGVSIGK